MAKPDGGPAFPAIESWDEWSENKCEYVQRFGQRGGMTLRDWFAGQLYIVTLIRQGGSYTDEEDFAVAARDAYRRADAMLAEREKE